MSVNKVIYGTTVLVDLTQDTVDSEHLALGYTAHDKSGAFITGTMVGKECDNDAWPFTATNNDKHQRLIVKLNGMRSTISGNKRNFDDSVTGTLNAYAQLGAEWECKVMPDLGYIEGEVSGVEGATGVVEGPIEISVSPAIIQTFTVTIVQSPNQTITVTCNGVAHTETFVAEFGQTYNITIESDAGFKAGELNILSEYGMTLNDSGYVDVGFTVSATEAKPNGSVIEGDITILCGWSNDNNKLGFGSQMPEGELISSTLPTDVFDNSCNFYSTYRELIMTLKDNKYEEIEVSMGSLTEILKYENGKGYVSPDRYHDDMGSLPGLIFYIGDINSDMFVGALTFHIKLIP